MYASWARNEFGQVDTGWRSEASARRRGSMSTLMPGSTPVLRTREPSTARRFRRLTSRRRCQCRCALRRGLHRCRNGGLRRLVLGLGVTSKVASGSRRIAHGVSLRPLPCIVLLARTVAAIQVGDLGHQPIIHIGRRHQRKDRGEQGADVERRLPASLARHIQVDAALAVDIGVVDLN